MKAPEGVTAEELNPQPPGWPQCETCGVSWIMRRALSFGTGEYSWVWMRDCAKPRSTCKNATTIIVTADGPVA